MTEILILDYNRHEELLKLLLSLKEKAKFHKKIVVLNNGGKEYAQDFLEADLCDKVIHNKINVGCGLGTVQLFAQCESDYAFYIQVDHLLTEEINQEHVNKFKYVIDKYGAYYIDLAGNQGQGKYSERAQFIKKEDYFKAAVSAGGPGPLEDLKWSEESIQDYMSQNKRGFASVNKDVNMVQPHEAYPVFADCGWSSTRQNPDGSEWLHRPHNKRLWLVKGPVKEKFSYPPLSDKEWDEVIKTQKWEDGKIPENQVKDSFNIQGWPE